MPADSELVPLGTHILSSSLAQAFNIPFSPPEEHPREQQLPTGGQQLVTNVVPEHQPSSSVPFFTQAYPSDRDGSNSRPGSQPYAELASPFRTYDSSHSRPGLPARPASAYLPSSRPADMPPPFREPGIQASIQQGGPGAQHGMYPGLQEAYTQSTKHTIQHAEPAQKSAGSLDTAGEENLARALKRPRLVWTSKLHARFVEAVNHLGLKSAVPKNIMQMMSVEGLTRENVASHLQKYRLQLRKEGKDIVDSTQPGDAEQAPGSPHDVAQHAEIGSDSEGAHDAELNDDAEIEEPNAMPVSLQAVHLHTLNSHGLSQHPMRQAVGAPHRGQHAQMAGMQMMPPPGALSSYGRMLDRQPHPGVRRQ